MLFVSFLIFLLFCLSYSLLISLSLWLRRKNWIFSRKKWNLWTPFCYLVSLFLVIKVKNWIFCLKTETLSLWTLFRVSVGTIRFWIGTVVEPFGWKVMAYMYGKYCLTENPTSYHTLVLGEVQTVDCGMSLILLSLFLSSYDRTYTLLLVFGASDTW